MRRLARLLIVLALLLGCGWLAYTLLLRAVAPVGDLPVRVEARLAAHAAPYSPLSSIPATVQNATIQTEDERFEQHHGIDLLGLLRSVYDDVTHRCFCEGGSTITEQLAKQIYLGGSDASLSRKLESMLLALKIEQHYSKGQILEFYLNTTYYGHGAYGVGQAARMYWDLPIGAVDLAQAALIAGLPQAPSDYDPIEHPDAARERRSQVLKLMRDAGVITSAQAEAANATPVLGISVPLPGTFPARASS